MTNACLSTGSKRRTLTAWGLPVLAAAIVASAPGAAAASPHKITDGQLNWGVKESFRNYLKSSIANGGSEASNGATVADDGSFNFSKGSGAVSASGVTEASFQGAVHFTGHDGILDFTLSNPKIQLNSAGKGQLLITDTEANGTSKVISIANLSGSPAVAKDGSLSINKLAATLTADGVKVFSYEGHGFYPTGQEMDPVSVSATLADEGSSTTPTPTPTTTPTSPGTTAPTTQPTTSTTPSAPATKPTEPPTTTTSPSAPVVVPTGGVSAPSGSSQIPGTKPGVNAPAEGPKVNTDRVNGSSSDEGIFAVVAGLGVIAAGGGVVWARRSTR